MTVGAGGSSSRRTRRASKRARQRYRRRARSQKHARELASVGAAPQEASPVEGAAQEVAGAAAPARDQPSSSGAAVAEPAGPSRDTGDPGSGEASDHAGSEDEDPARPARPQQATVTVERARRRLVVVLALLGVAGVTLTLIGIDMVWSSTTGRYVGPGLQSDDPNYVALVTPTPTLLVVSVDEEGTLVGVTLASLRSGDGGGSVIVMPVGTRAPATNEPVTTSSDAEEEPTESTEAAAGEDTITLAELHEELGVTGVRRGVERIFRVAVAEVIEVDEAGWGSLVDPVEPLRLTVPDDVGSRWSAGEIDLDAADVGDFLAATTEDESELNRVARQELFWQAWVPAVRSAGEQAVPGEVDAGLGRFVRALSAGPLSVSGLPVSSDADGDLFTVEPAVIADIVAREIPYPQEPWAGSRIRVRLLNGTTDADLSLRATGPLVMAHAEIAITGNAGSFDQARTTFVYSGDDQREAAEALRDALGVGVVEQEPQSGSSRQVDEDDRVDVTVTLGADASRAIGRLETTD